MERDIYGFRKGSRWVSVEEVRKFEEAYKPSVERRAAKWDALLREGGGAWPARGSKVKRYIRKGIPSALRGECWMHYSGAGEAMKRHRGRYHQLLAQATEGRHAANRELIERDLHRTFPENIRFKSNLTTSANPTTGAQITSLSTTLVPGLQSLRRILTAFAVRNPHIGYCQSLNYIAALALIFLSEEEAFWLLCTVVEKIMPDGMYSVTMDGVTVDQEVLMGLVYERLPGVWRRIVGGLGGDEDGEDGDGGGLPVTLVTSHWFLTMFADVLPIETVLRVWDCIF
ncbi:rab-GTPase-TBC domain-containing protein [Piptocephalis cylindrospora]|uniref:Rab-GTPase-TBC domain-containing protein n=1 Tax=Piptocephalis cylindrospora TaxID=1907219 RepID=A0A4P9Y586_9FUNG|nr:rab-GTPase-TBC domain-containing protein [Piptocephalis cylindrospora]|eukprot:RKP13341.1 rab-GTPase-TBC domain-containing protein [Piptocephalis cylindrospora]